MNDLNDKILSHLPPDDVPCFGVVLTWPKIKNAEYEVVKRIEKASKNIGVKVHIIDNDGYPLWSNSVHVLDKTKRVSRNDCKFIISLHFESPRLYDIPSYSALWNPSDYFDVFGYDRTIQQFASHSDVLSCDSKIADTHGLGVYLGLGRELPLPLSTLFHSVPGPYPKPNINENSRLFYIGINWERIGGKKGRHQDLLENLDKEDLIYIYGPDLFNGVRPWEDFKTYQGPIPFDGESVVAKINEAGICLAFSSQSHQRSGIMSNRLFEALAAGSVVIANPHPFIEKHFSDCVYVIDDRLTSEEQNEQVRRLVVEIRSNPAQAQARAQRGQDRFKASFTLESCLRRLFDTHNERSQQIATMRFGGVLSEITVILNYTGSNSAVMDRLLNDIDRQVFVSVKLLIICDRRFLEENDRKWSSRFTGAVKSMRTFAGDFLDWKNSSEFAKIRLMSDGLIFDKLLSSIDTEFFCTLQEDDCWFSDHLATLAASLRAMPKSDFSCSGKIIETQQTGKDIQQDLVSNDLVQEHDDFVPRRKLDSLLFNSFEAMIEVHYPRDVGRFLYRSTLIELLPRFTLQLLDGMHHRVFALFSLLKSYPAQTNYASYVQLIDIVDNRPSPYFSEVQQFHAIRDAVRSNNRWLELSSALREYRPSLVSDYQPEPVVVDHLYDLRLKGEGAAYLRSGFSTPEELATWIDGRTGVMEFIVDRPVSAGSLDFLLVALGRTTKEGVRQVCTVVMQGMIIGQIELTESYDEFRLSIPDTVDLQGLVTVTFRVPMAEAVRGPQNELLDKRQLGMQIARFGVVEAYAQKHRQPDPVVVGHLYDLRLKGEGAAYLRSGFSTPEELATWIDGRTGVMEFIVDRPVSAGSLDFLLVALGRTTKEGVRQVCTVVMQGMIIGQIELTESYDEFRLSIPDTVDLQGLLTVTFRVPMAEAVRGPQNELLDRRQLGMQIARFGVVEARDCLTVGELYGLGVNDEGANFLSKGFSAPEPNYVWICGRLANIKFNVISNTGLLKLLITVAGRVDTDGTKQRCAIFANGNPLGVIQVEEEEEQFCFQMPLSLQLGSNKISLDLILRHANPVVDQAGKILDPRNLGMRISQIGVFGSEFEQCFQNQSRA